MRRAYMVWVVIRRNPFGSPQERYRFTWVRCTLPAQTFPDALRQLTDHFHQRGFLVEDVLAFELYDLDDWDFGQFPVESPEWASINEAIRQGHIVQEEIDSLLAPDWHGPSRRAWLIVTTERMLTDVVPGAVGKVGVKPFLVPTSTIEEALGEVARCIREDERHLEDIYWCYSYDLDRWNPRYSKRGALYKAVKRVVRKREVWEGWTIFVGGGGRSEAMYMIRQAFFSE